MTILSLLAVLILLQLSMPHKYVWLETHDGNDSEPYGCMVFDSVMRSSMPKGYEVTDKRLNQIADGRHNVLIAAEKLNLSETEADALKRMLNNGATVMIAVTNFLRDETDSILAYDYGVVHCKYLFRDVSNLINQNNDNDYRPYTTIFYDKSNGSTPERCSCMTSCSALISSAMRNLNTEKSPTCSTTTGQTLMQGFTSSPTSSGKRDNEGTGRRNEVEKAGGLQRRILQRQ